MGVEFQIVAGVVIGQRIGQRAGDGAVMLGDAFQGFPCQVQPVEISIMAFERGDDAHRLGVVVEPAIGFHQRIERILACMAEGGVAEVMRQRHRLGQFRIQAQRSGDGAGDLRHLDRMGQAGTEIIALMLDEDLGLVFQPPEGRGMDDPVAVALKARAERAFGLGIEPAAAFRRIGRIGRGAAHCHICLNLPGLCGLPILQLREQENRPEFQRCSFPPK